VTEYKNLSKHVQGGWETGVERPVAEKVRRETLVKRRPI